QVHTLSSAVHWSSQIHLIVRRLLQKRLLQKDYLFLSSDISHGEEHPDLFGLRKATLPVDLSYNSWKMSPLC
ncbi:MAG: hypothetical protein PWK00_03575, partial [Coxiella burnetii]|nr:hypothetical protein [Coxiella burnetii]